MKATVTSTNAPRGSISAKPWGTVGDDKATLTTFTAFAVADSTASGTTATSDAAPATGGSDEPQQLEEVLSVSVCDYGCLVQSVKFRGREMQLGFDTLEGYLNDGSYIGVGAVGRYANRIANARFELDGEVFDKLATNVEEKHTLHGGIKGFHKAMWTTERIETREEIGVALSYVSPDGEEGFPADLRLHIEYYIPFAQNPAALRMRVKADISESSARSATVCSIANHCYWNLEDYTQRPEDPSATPTTRHAVTALGHYLQLESDFYTPATSESVPTGEVAPVKNTRFDFTENRPVIDQADLFAPVSITGVHQYKTAQDYDNNFVLRGQTGVLRKAATLRNADQTTELVVSTTLPGVQLYTACYLPRSVGHGGAPIDTRSAICLEPQFFPDSPNMGHFPSCVVRKGVPVEHTSTFEFSNTCTK